MGGEGEWRAGERRFEGGRGVRGQTLLEICITTPRGEEGKEKLGDSWRAGAHTSIRGTTPRSFVISRRERERYCHPPSLVEHHHHGETRACLQWLCPANVYACIKTTLSSSCLPLLGGEGRGVLSICGPWIVNRV